MVHNRFWCTSTDIIEFISLTLQLRLACQWRLGHQRYLWPLTKVCHVLISPNSRCICCVIGTMGPLMVKSKCSTQTVEDESIEVDMLTMAIEQDSWYFPCSKTILFTPSAGFSKDRARVRLLVPVPVLCRWIYRPFPLNIVRNITYIPKVYPHHHNPQGTMAGNGNDFMPPSYSKYIDSNAHPPFTLCLCEEYSGRQ